MRRILQIMIIGVLMPIGVYAQETQKRTKQAEPSDSIKEHILDEVVVEGASQFTSPSKSVYTPTKKIKETSFDANSMLSRMAIPEILVSPVNGITTNSGKNISIFINYMPADASDQQALNTRDVLRVEYLEYPSDPRFRNAEYVINFILKEYEYGGYTKVWNRTDIEHKINTSTSLFQRLSYKKTTFDLFANYQFEDRTHMGETSTEVFRIPQSDETFNEFTRQQNFLDSKKLSTKVPISFRVSYATDKVSIRNTIGYSFSNMPLSRNHGNLSISNHPDELFDYSSYASSRSNSVAWNGLFYFSLPKRWSLNLSNSFAYSYRNNNNSYQSSYDNTSITNDAREKAYNYRGSLDISKEINKHHSVGANILGVVKYNHIDYFGENPVVEHFASPFISGSLSYSYNSNNFYSMVKAGMQWEGRRVNGKKNYRMSPSIMANLTYSYNNKNRTSLFGQYTQGSATASASAPAIIQQNEFMYETGNPDLSPYTLVTAELSHTFLPNNMFNLSAFLSYAGFYNRITSIYFPIMDNALVNTYINNGDYQSCTIGTNLSFRYKQKLSLTVSPKISFYHLTGLYRKNYSPFSINAYGNYYFGDFNVGFYCHSPEASVYTDSPQYGKNKLYTQFSIGWAGKGFNINLYACNPFRDNFKFFDYKIDTPYYHYNSIQYSPQYSRMFIVQVYYTFNFGKKVNQGNEISGQGGAGSAILN